jgi:hypothetical protein
MITFLFHFFPFYRKAAGRASVKHEKARLRAQFDRRGAVNISTKTG